MGKQWKAGIKAENASKKGAMLIKYVKEIQVASKLGGPDPANNMRLRLAVEAAKAVSCPKDTIERAIKRGAGLLDDGKEIEELTYEGYGPHQVGVIVECQTDNRARTAPDLRLIFSKAGGNMGETGSVSWMFDRVCLIEAVKAGEFDPEEEAIEAGADDVERDDEDSSKYSFYGAPDALGEVRDQLIARGWDIKVAELAYRPKNKTDLTEEQEAEVVAFLEKLDTNEDSYRIYATI